MDRLFTILQTWSVKKGNYTIQITWLCLMSEWLSTMISDVRDCSFYIFLNCCLIFGPVLKLAFVLLLDRSLMIGWRKKSWNPERCPLHSLSCLSVCMLQQSTYFDLWIYLFGLSDPRDMRTKHIFQFFEISIFALFIDIFSPKHTLEFCISLKYWSQVFSYLWYLGLIPLKKMTFEQFWKFNFPH